MKITVPNANSIYAAYVDDENVPINNLKHSVYKHKDTQLWWIEDVFNVPCANPIGPFDTPELAWSTLQLLKD